MSGLTPTARRLHRLLVLDRQLAAATGSPERLTEATNDQLADLLGVTSRSVTTALSRLVDAKLVTVESRRGHPSRDRAARTLQVVSSEPTSLIAAGSATGILKGFARAAAASREENVPRPRPMSGPSPAAVHATDAISSSETGEVRPCP